MGAISAYHSLTSTKVFLCSYSMIMGLVTQGKLHIEGFISLRTVLDQHMQDLGNQIFVLLPS